MLREYFHACMEHEQKIHSAVTASFQDNAFKGSNVAFKRMVLSINH